jgi:tetratricopeptide (TPR) repeat protein
MAAAASPQGGESMPRLSFSVRACLLCGCLLWQRSLAAAEPVWEIRGEVTTIGTDEPRQVELKLPDGATVRVPLAAFSDRSRTKILSEAEGAKPAAKRPDEGSSLAAVEAAVAGCRTAEEALRAVELLLAGGGSGVAEAEEAAMRARWEARARRGEVRLGREWVSPDAAAAAAKAADDVLTELATMVRLGNFKSLRDYLEKASRADPASGRADFLLGLANAFGVGQRADVDKALRQFAEVVAREPGNGAALNNLAVCEVAARRFDDALDHFAAAAERLPDPQAVAGNVALVVAGANDRRSKLSSKQTEAFSALYRRLVAGQPGQGPPPSQSAPTFLSPFGQPLAAGLNFADLFAPPPGGVVERRGRGIVVVTGMVLAPASILFPAGSVAVRPLDGTGGELPAKLVAASPELGVALLRCGTLAAPPVRLAASVPAVGGEVIAVQPAAAGRAGSGPAPTPGVVRAAEVLPGLFVHTATGPRGPAGIPLVDAGGRVIGLVAATPEVPVPGPPRAFGTAIERVWPFLREHLPDLEPTAPASSALAWEGVVGEVSGRMVEIVARPAP